MLAGKEKIHQFAAQLGEFAPAAVEGGAVVELGIHGSQILQEQLDGIHLALVEQAHSGLGGNSFHG